MWLFPRWTDVIKQGCWWCAVAQKREGKTGREPKQTWHLLGMQHGLQCAFQREQSSLWHYGACQIAWKARRKESSFTQFYKAKENFIFWTISPKLLKELNLWSHLSNPAQKGEQKEVHKVKADFLTPQGRLKSTQIMWQELTTAKRASSCPFAFLIHTEQKKKKKVLKSFLFVKGWIATGGGWVQQNLLQQKNRDKCPGFS